MLVYFSFAARYSDKNFYKPTWNYGILFRVHEFDSRFKSICLLSWYQIQEGINLLQKVFESLADPSKNLLFILYVSISK